MGGIFSNIVNSISEFLITRFFSSESKEDKYLDDFVVPIVSDALVLANGIRLKNELGVNFSKIDIIEYFTKQYFSNLLKNGFSYDAINHMLQYYPHNVLDNIPLISEYIAHAGFVKFVEPYENSNFLIIDLEGNSRYDDLNILSSILREHLSFARVSLLFTVDSKQSVNFLKLTGIIYNGKILGPNHSQWKEFLIDAFTLLFLVLQIIHGLWHLISAHIVYVAQQSLQDTPILDLFNMSEKNIYLKALEVKTILFGTKHIFGQDLNDNPQFNLFVKNYLSDFFNQFNIDTIYEDYFIHDLPQANWIIGMQENINSINRFVNKVFESEDFTKENEKFNQFVEKKYIINADLAKSPNLLRKYLEILLVVGGSFHSLTLEFGKLIFTDLLKKDIFNAQFYQIATAVITISKDDNFLGDIRLYDGNAYNQQILDFTADLYKSRIETNKLILQNQIYRPAAFTSIDVANHYVEINTPSTYV